MEVVHDIAQLGGTVFVTCAFLYYLWIKNGRTEKIQERLVERLDIQTRLLIKVADAHKLDDEELLKS